MSTPETQAPDIEDALDRTLGTDTSADRTPPAAETPAEAPESGADEPAGITAGGRTFATSDELAKAYAELQASYSATRPVEPEPEPEYVDPWAAVPGLPQEYKDNVREWALEEPLAAGIWAWENRESLPDKVYRDLVRHAMANDDVGWEQYRHEQYAQMASQAAEDRTSGFIKQQVEEVGNAAEAAIVDKLGAEEYAKYKDRIEERIAKGQYVTPERTWSGPVPPPHVLLDINYKIYRDLWNDDHFEEVKKMYAAAPQAPAAAATQTRSQAGGAPSDVEGALDRALGLA